ncbi:MAG: hypothetical protein ACLTYN_02500 [Dysosmobacter welbionis]
MWPLPRTALWRAALRHAGDRPLLPGTYHCGGGGGRQKGERRDLRAGHAPPSVNKKDTVVFEDAFHAIQTAKAAGFRVAAVYDASRRHTGGDPRAGGLLYPFL